MIPNSVLSKIEKVTGQQVQSSNQVSGGSINQAAKVTLSDGRPYFLKWNTSADARMFTVEEKGLALLASAQTSLRIPAVSTTGKTDDNIGFLLQEFIAEGHANPNSASDFGRQLAQLHQHHEEKYGLDHNNYIGKLPQSNTWHKNWIDFFIQERMEPQLKMATDSGKLGTQTVTQFEAMYQKLCDIFPDEPPSLLHGDLWSGNYFFDEKGQATVYDPAVYYGHREMELAFTHLFGGFPSKFYSAYKEKYPLESGFSERKDIYNLYPLLVHTNLFGGSYGRQVQGIAAQF
ncbi:fructosamine kinase family protein [Fodinibius sp. Rm-B-1B1-1]|uniref:fructosamine kinase family protein n=1 Tax=Fodinibius alkaliphilus TaxID=3140241 RepID=UPI003159D30B